jgi:catabolite regulation protein CreA
MGQSLEEKRTDEDDRKIVIEALAEPTMPGWLCGNTHAITSTVGERLGSGETPAETSSEQRLSAGQAALDVVPASYA